MSEQTPAPVDYTPTHRVTRISNGAPNPFRLFFHVLGRSLDFAPAEEGGSPQDVCAAVAKGIEGDPSLAPHFTVEELNPSAVAVEGGHVADAAAKDVAGAPATEGAAASRSSRSKRTEPAT